MATDILAFCRVRGIETEEIKVYQTVDFNKKHTDNTQIQLQVDLPPDFPDKYVKALKNFAKQCLVSKLTVDMTAESYLTPLVRKRTA